MFYRSGWLRCDVFIYVFGILGLSWCGVYVWGWFDVWCLCYYTIIYYTYTIISYILYLILYYTLLLSSSLSSSPLRFFSPPYLLPILPSYILLFLIPSSLIPILYNLLLIYSSLPPHSHPNHPLIHSIRVGTYIYLFIFWR